MKKLFIACLVAIMTIGAANAQEQKKETNENEHGPKIVFAEREHNYGTIQKGGDGNCVFTFTNTQGKLRDLFQWAMNEPIPAAE